MTTPTQTAWFTQVSESGRTDFNVQRCRSCSTAHFPPTVERCRGCWSTNLEIDQLSGVGWVYSFTEVHRSFPGLDTPFIVAIVEMKDGLRITARLKGNEIRIGDEVVAFASEADGRVPALAYEFRLKKWSNLGDGEVS